MLWASLPAVLDEITLQTGPEHKLNWWRYVVQVETQGGDCQVKKHENKRAAGTQESDGDSTMFPAR